MHLPKAYFYRITLIVHTALAAMISHTHPVNNSVSSEDCSSVGAVKRIFLPKNTEKQSRMSLRKLDWLSTMTRAVGAGWVLCRISPRLPRDTRFFNSLTPDQLKRVKSFWLSLNFFGGRSSEGKLHLEPST